jgi:zinc protease
LAQGSDSLFYDDLVRKKGLTGEVSAGINFGLGNMFDYSGPMLWIAQFFHDSSVSSDALLGAVDAIVEKVRKEGLDQSALERARVKMRSDLYANLEQFAGFGRANLLASFALFDDDPSKINQLEEGFEKVTPALVQKTAAEYLRAGNRTVYVITPGKTAAQGEKETR